MPAPRFDLQLLYAEIDRARQRARLTWSALSRQVGVSPSTIRRFATADDAEADGVLALIRWLDTRPEDYIQNNAVAGLKLATEAGYIRVDMRRVAAAHGDSNGTRDRTRTTIQRLVDAADMEQQPVEAFTRITNA